MFRFFTFRNAQCSKINYISNTSSILKSDFEVPVNYCFNCRFIRDNSISDGTVRFQSTRAALSRKSTRKKGKIKNARKYVELLEVNDKSTTETKASVSKLNATHLSQLIANIDVSLSELHKLGLSNKGKVNKITNIDTDLHKEIEDVMLNKYKKNDSYSFKEDDCALIFAYNRTPGNILFRTKEGVKSIKDSYDKFRRETVQKQKMKDIVLAINEGLHQYESTTDHMLTNSQQRIKTRQETFKDFLSAVENSELSNYDSVLHALKGRGVHFPSLLNVERPEEGSKVKESDGDAHDRDNVLKTRTILHTNKKKTKAKNKTGEATTLQAQDFHLKSKEFSLNKLLRCHLDICIEIGNVDKAWHIFKYYRRKGVNSNKHPKLKNIDLFNTLLRGFAEKGNYTAVCNILDMINNDGLHPTVETYAAIFECIDKSTVESKHSLLLKFKDEMLKKDITLNDLIEKVKNSDIQNKHILSAIQIVQPSFSPEYKVLDTSYDCSLVNNLNRFGNCDKDNIKYMSPAETLFSHKELIERSVTQLKNEESGVVHVHNIMVEDKPSETVSYYRHKLHDWEEETRRSLHKAFLRYLGTLKSQSNASNNPLNIVPYLSLLKVDDFVEIMMTHIGKIARGSESFSPSCRSLQKDMGKKVNMQYEILRKKKDGVSSKVLDLYSQYCDWYLNRDGSVCDEPFNSRKAWEKIIHKNSKGASLDIEYPSWPTSVNVCVGKFLHNIIMNDVHVDVNIFKKNKKRKLVPALYNIFRSHGYRRKNELKPHPVLVKLLTGSACPTLSMETSLIPSLCPPLPWRSSTMGGYLISKTPVIRVLMGATQQLKLLETAPPQKLFPCLDSLNQLGSIPWTVNKPILDLMIQIFRNGGSKEFNIAMSSSALPASPPIKGNLSKKEKSLAYRLRAQVSREKQEMHSLWCDLLYKLSLANHYRDKIFWLPHNMDFRGRTYPCPPHLSHLGSDISRAIMKFAKGMPLGPNGLKWLKIQCVNLTGTMKRNTLNERLAHADEIMDDILDSADNPLDGKRWWVQSEDPWQTLACCMEIANALRSPNHEEYICHVPVHQDGSCNGLQHYAALGRDDAGAFSVNLAAADRPQDVYSAVVNLVEASRIKDAADGVQVAMVLEGYIKRKVIKQTIMTTVYGVTKFGARLQIAKQLKDIDDFPREHIWAASFYLAKKTFESLTEMFTSTKKIQDWFTECARLISSVRSEKMEWVTPLGLPIVQPYHKATKPTYHSNDALVEYAAYDEMEKPCTMKQKNAFPPNFIHSLDASHMMLTSLNCEANNVTFVSVHDCFWTHAATVELMSKICREQFVALHSQPILENLSQYLYNKYSLVPGNSASEKISHQALLKLLQELPERGSFDLRNVFKSTYFFS